MFHAYSSTWAVMSHSLSQTQAACSTQRMRPLQVLRAAPRPHVLPHVVDCTTLTPTLPCSTTARTAARTRPAPASRERRALRRHPGLSRVPTQAGGLRPAPGLAPRPAAYGTRHAELSTRVGSAARG